MIRLGIVTRSELRELGEEQARPPIAYTILAEFPETLDPIDERGLEWLYEWLPAGADTLKRKLTFPGRYKEADILLTEALSSRDPGSPLRIHDMAVSNAITSVDLFHRVEKLKNVSFYATDFFDRLYVVRLTGSAWVVIFDAEHDPVQIIRHRFVCFASRRESTLANRIAAAFARWRAIASAKRQLVEGRGVKEISLFHPRSLALARSDARFRLGRENLLTATGTFDVVRVMSGFANLPEQRVVQGLQAVSNQVVDGGLLMIGRHPKRHDASTPVSLLRRNGERFLVYRELFGGDPLAAKLVSMRFPAKAPSLQ
jgi:hypothetical protein